MHGRPGIKREVVFRDRNQNKAVRQHPNREKTMKRIENQNATQGRIISGEVWARMAMLITHASLGSGVIPWCVHGCKTPAFDFVGVRWGAKWKMVNPPVSPEQDAEAALKDLGRLPSWTNKLLNKVFPAARTKLMMPEMTREFVVVEILNPGQDSEKRDAAVSKVWDLAERGMEVVVYTRDLTLWTELPIESVIMGTLGDRIIDDSKMQQDHAVWFTALKASRIYTTTEENKLFVAHFKLAGIPQELILSS
jgi:hypothetical protein